MTNLYISNAIHQVETRPIQNQQKVTFTGRGLIIVIFLGSQTCSQTWPMRTMSDLTCIFPGKSKQSTKSKDQIHQHHIMLRNCLVVSSRPLHSISHWGASSNVVHQNLVVSSTITSYYLTSSIQNVVLYMYVYVCIYIHIYIIYHTNPEKSIQ